MSIDQRVIANTLDNRQIAANGQFTTDSPQRSETLMTLSQTSGQVTVPRISVGITVFCIVALPRDRLGITAREVKGYGGPDGGGEAGLGGGPTEEITR